MCIRDRLAQANVAWFHAGPTTEFQTVNLFNLLVQTGETDGARVFTMGGAAAADEESFVLEQLEALRPTESEQPEAQ